MDEIKDTISILKVRWPEVFLILGLNLLFSLGSLPLQQLLKQLLEVNPSLGLAACVLPLALIVITALLSIGFQRSVHLEGQKRQSPLALLRLGKHFFWRTVGVGLLLMLASLLLAWLVFLVIKRPSAGSAGFLKTAQTEPLVYFGCYAMSQLLLIKPMLFIMPVVIVTDCRISASFGSLKRFRLSEAEGLVIVFVTFTALTMVHALLPPARASWTISHHILRITSSLTQGLIGMMMCVMGIRFVGSRSFLDEADPDVPDFDGASP